MKFNYLDKGDREVCESILRKLPDWFGIEESTLDYIRSSSELPMFTVVQNQKAIGFLSLKNHSCYTSEIYVMGVDPDFHRKGIGLRLVQEAQRELAKKNIEFLQVKTLSEDRECSFYKKTRLFYKSIGFKEVEIFPTLWGESNPCQLLIKNIEV